MPLRILNQTKSLVLATCAELADTEHKRMRGLLDRQSIAPGEGLLIHNCKSIHTVGMHFPIDVVFVNANSKVSNVVPALASNHHVSDIASKHVLELPSGMAQSTEVGDQLIFHRL